MVSVYPTNTYRLHRTVRTSLCTYVHKYMWGITYVVLFCSKQLKHLLCAGSNVTLKKMITTLNGVCSLEKMCTKFWLFCGWHVKRKVIWYVTKLLFLKYYVIFIFFKQLSLPCFGSFKFCTSKKLGIGFVNIWKFAILSHIK